MKNNSKRNQKSNLILSVRYFKYWFGIGFEKETESKLKMLLKKMVLIDSHCSLKFFGRSLEWNLSLLNSLSKLEKLWSHIMLLSS